LPFSLTGERLMWRFTADRDGSGFSATAQVSMTSGYAEQSIFCEEKTRTSFRLL
jgi:hypothetical protein